MNRKINMDSIEGWTPEKNLAIIKELLSVLEKQKYLANEVLKLNPNSTEIGQGRLLNLIELAKECIWGVEL